MSQTENLNIESISKIISPKEVKSLYPSSEKIKEHVSNYRKEIQDILSGKDKRLISIIGPCSIHDYAAAIEYAKKLKVLSEEVKDKLLIVMRVYFEKPRTTIGWKGLINDPYLNESFMLEEGIKLARKLLLEINELGLPVATEALDPVSPQYLSDLISWGAIGARTTESQTHREMASGLSFPIGFKNGTDGSIDVSINAMLSSSSGHSFLGIDEEGVTSIIKTTGNPFTHIILRGGKSGVNYKESDILFVRKELIKKQLSPNIIVDCSHANSEKDYNRQEFVLQNIINQKVKNPNESIKGFMLESNIKEGSQQLELVGKENLEYGLSITDGCISFETTERIIKESYEVL